MDLRYSEADETFRLEVRAWLDEAVPVIRAMVGHVIERGLPRHTILNINLPDRPLAASAIGAMTAWAHRC